MTSWDMRCGRRLTHRVTRFNMTSSSITSGSWLRSSASMMRPSAYLPFSFLHKKITYNWNRFLPLLYFVPTILSIWDKGKCNTKYLYFLMESIYRLGPFNEVPRLGIPIFDDRIKKDQWLKWLFPNPEGVRGRHCEWQESLGLRAPALRQRLSIADGVFDILYALKALERFLYTMGSRDAEKFINKGIFKVAADACARGMDEADYVKKVSIDGVRISRLMSGLLENIYL